MNKSDAENTDYITIDGRTMPLENAVLPEGFGKRIVRLKEASKFTWNGMAQAIGIDPKSLLRWAHQGVEPSGGAMLSLLRFASRIPGGVEILMGKGVQLSFFEQEES